MMLVRAGADEAQRRAVLRRALAHQPADLHLVERCRDAGEFGGAQGRRDLIEQRVEARDPDHREHLLDVRARMRDERHQSLSRLRSSV
jgi:hypothetical protein